MARAEERFEKWIFVAVALVLVAACGDPSKPLRPLRPSAPSTEGVPGPGTYIVSTCPIGNTEYDALWRFTASIIEEGNPPRTVEAPVGHDVFPVNNLCGASPNQLILNGVLHDNSYEFARVHWYKRKVTSQDLIYCGTVELLPTARGASLKALPVSGEIDGNCKDGAGQGGRLTLDWTPANYPVGTVGTVPSINLVIGNAQPINFGYGFARGPAPFRAYLKKQTYAGTVADPTIATISCGVDTCTITSKKIGSTTYTVTTGGVTTQSASLTVWPPGLHAEIISTNNAVDPMLIPAPTGTTDTYYVTFYNSVDYTSIPGITYQWSIQWDSGTWETFSSDPSVMLSFNCAMAEHQFTLRLVLSAPGWGTGSTEAYYTVTGPGCGEN